jgi:hypothetical protein
MRYYKEIKVHASLLNRDIRCMVILTNKLVENEENTCFLVVLRIQHSYELVLRRSNNIKLE